MNALSGKQDRSQGSRQDGGGWVERLARFGFSTKGAVYLIIGGLAAWAAAWESSEATGRQGAVEIVREQPFGRIFLGIAAIGLGCHGIWRLLQAVFDTERDGRGWRGWIMRSSYAFRGLVYLVFMSVTAAFALATDSVVGDEPAERWTRWLLSLPLGTWLVVGLGVAVVLVGLLQFVLAYRCRFDRSFERRDYPRFARRFILWIGRFGLAARGVTFWIIGGFLIVAGVQFDAGRVKNLGESLQFVAAQPYGPALLGAVAAGLIAYGAAFFTYGLCGIVDGGQVFEK